MKVISAIRLCRPGQWVKNLFVFMPLFFSGKLLCADLAWYAAVAFMAFCLAASAVYCLNDLKDAEYDRSHSLKRLRPVAAGEVGATACIVMMVLLSIAALIMTIFLLPGAESRYSTIIIAAYILLNIAYCFKLKQVPIIDVTVISLGFVLRVCIGGTATGISLSPWIIIMTFQLALFLALSKRRDDILIFQTTGQPMRHNIDKYNLMFMNQAITMVGTVMLVSYIIYTVSPDVIARLQSDFVYTTSIFVLLGLLRYMQLAIVFSKTGSPTRVLYNDRFLQICVLGWAALFAVIIYC